MKMSLILLVRDLYFIVLQFDYTSRDGVRAVTHFERAPITIC